MSTRRAAAIFLPVAVLLWSWFLAAPKAARPLQAHECTVTANDFAFSPSRIEVRQDEIVRITFRAVDIPHTFTIDEYRIAKRAAIGQAIVFEFRADRVGTFPIYCSLTADDRCRRMKGELVVRKP
ncbi:MAG TPA: cupredoxin domain-containing protein [Vicinamibacterales bacterium]|nr:cupredoxin domain-containing protein [Vicinamibacterales bacterium]